MSRLLMFLLIVCLPLSSLAATTHLALRGLDGKTHHLDAYRGRWVVVNYWASWCSPCREEIPQLVDFSNHHRGHVVVLGVDMEHLGHKRLAAFVREHGINYTVLVDGVDTKPLRSLRGLPTTFLIDPNGRLVAEHVGPVTAKGLDTFIERHKTSMAKEPKPTD